MKHIVVVMTAILIILSVDVMKQSIAIQNLERKYCKMEHYCDKIIEENQLLQRQVESTLKMMSEGGWNAFTSSSTSN